MYRCNRVAVEAPAKVNLFLDITGIAPNGYHLLDTVMQAVDLRDLVVVGRSAASGIRLTCTRPGIPEDDSNIAWRAAELFCRETGIKPDGISIHIDKAIPDQAGLGGGSSDGAAVLAGMNALFATGLSDERLCELGLRLGADVPFLIHGGCAHAQGVGEQLTPLFPGLRPCRIVLAKPAGGMSTKHAYDLYDKAENSPPRTSDPIRTAIVSGSLQNAAQRMYNVFEHVPGACPAEVMELKAAMLNSGALGAAMTGTGSAVAGIFADQKQAETCLTALSGKAAETYLTAPVLHGAKIVHQS